MHCYVDVFRG